MLYTRTQTRRLFCAFIVTLTLAVAPADVARADLGACFAALAPVGQAAKAAEVGSTAAACLSAASGDPVMAMTIAAMTAAAVGGMFSTIGECNDLIDSALGQVIAAALLTLPLPLSDEHRNLLEQFAKGNMPPGLSFRELIAAIPVLNALPVYMQCGCNVAGAPGEFAKIANEYMNSVEDCVNFFGDAADAFLEWLGSGFESLFGGHDFVPGIQQEAECYIHEMPAGIWTESGLSARSQAGCGSTVCPEGLVIVEKTAASGKKQYMCSPTCLEGAKTIQSGGACYAQDNSTAVDGRCQFTGQTVECCDEGQRAFQWGVCSPACIDGYQYWDKQANQCRNCSTGWYPVYQAPGNSIGQCKECPAGQVYDANAAKCEPLECKPPIGYFDAKKPHECAACTPGQIYSASTNKCECSEGTFAKGTACVCPQGATKVNWTATFTCACPEGSTLDTEKFACVCSAGAQIQQVNVGGTIYTSCTPISRCRSNSVRGPDGRCKQCGRGQIAQGSRCVFLTEIRRRLQGLPIPSGSKTVIPAVPVEPCPRGMRRIRGSCVPPRLPPAVTSGPGFGIHRGTVGPRPPMSRRTPTPRLTPAPRMMRVAPR